MRYKISVVFILLMITLLSGCDRMPESETGSAGITVYDIGADMSHIEPAVFEQSPGDDISENVRILLQRLIDGPEAANAYPAIPDGVTDVTFTIANNNVAIDLGSSYNEVPAVRKVLCEAAVVRTLCQLDGIASVSFSVDNVPLTDSSGVPVGMLMPDSFVENDGSMINTYERAQLHLFFAGADGQSLVEKVENVTYNGNISMDRVIVDSLIGGPHSSDVFATVNPATRVNSVTTQDGICYVNLSADFLNKTTNASDEVMIYSIVNSLTDLGNINKVQILIDGDVNVKLGEYDLSGLFERKLEMMD